MMAAPQFDVTRAVQDVYSVWRELPELFNQFEDQHDLYLKTKPPPEPDLWLHDIIDEEDSVPIPVKSKVDLEEEKVVERRFEIKSQIQEIDESLSLGCLPSKAMYFAFNRSYSRLFTYDERSYKILEKMLVTVRAFGRIFRTRYLDQAWFEARAKKEMKLQKPEVVEEVRAKDEKLAPKKSSKAKKLKKKLKLEEKPKKTKKEKPQATTFKKKKIVVACVWLVGRRKKLARRKKRKKRTLFFALPSKGKDRRVSKDVKWMVPGSYNHFPGNMMREVYKKLLDVPEMTKHGLVAEDVYMDDKVLQVDKKDVVKDHHEVPKVHRKVVWKDVPLRPAKVHCKHVEVQDQVDMLEAGMVFLEGPHGQGGECKAEPEQLWSDSGGLRAHPDTQLAAPSA